MKADPKRIPVRGDNPEVWQNWHIALKSNFGKATANQLFLRAWAQRGESNDDSTLRAYLKDQGISLTTGVLGKTQDFASGIADSIGDIFSIGKYAGMAVGVVVLGSVGLLLFNIAKNPNATINSASKLRG